MICCEGACAERAWFVKRGWVALSRAAEHAPTKAVAQQILGAGAFLGLEATIDASYRYTAVALGPITLCETTGTAIEAWLGGRGSPARTALDRVLRAQVTLSPRAASTDGSAVCRVARWLLREARNGVAPPWPRRFVANLLGMTPETFSRAVARLAATGTVAVTRRELRVVDAGALSAHARLEGGEARHAAQPPKP